MESTESKGRQPTCVIVLGMAGSGKTTLVHRLSTELEPYVINLDPACADVPYSPHIDIRDTVDYRHVMQEYQLGPNGAIVTALNLFSTKFGDVLDLVGKQSRELCLLDTPGQIEVFTWSVSGGIISASLASAFPTVVVYVLDAVRSANPNTFMANMLYACSILYRMRLPFVVAMNKVDVVAHSYAVEWMRDIDAFQAALEAQDEQQGHAGYVGGLTSSMALALAEFYAGLRVCGVSAATGEGISDLREAIAEAALEYETVYRVELEAAKLAKKKPAPEGGLTLRHANEADEPDSDGEELRPERDEAMDLVDFAQFLQQRKGRTQPTAPGNPSTSNR